MPAVVRPAEAVPDQDPDEPDQPEERPQREAGDDLLAEDLVPIAKAQLLEGEGADDQAGGLGP